MGAEPGRRILIQPAAKLEPVIVVIDFDYTIDKFAARKAGRKMF